MADPLDLYEAAPPPAGLLAPYQPPAPLGPSAGGVLARSGLRGIVPAAGGFGGFVAGAEGGGIAGAPLDPFTGGGASVVLGLGGGLYGAYKGSQLADEAQTGVADAISGGGYSAQRIADQLAHPYAAFVGENAAQLAFMRPSAGLNLLPRAFGAVFGGGTEAGREAATGETLDPLRIGTAAAFGAAMDSETSLGSGIAGTIRRGAGATQAAIGANIAIAQGLRDVPGVDATAARDAFDPNISAATRAAMARDAALRAALGDRRTPDEIAAGNVIEGDAHTEANNPFTSADGVTPAIEQTHGEALATAMQQLDTGQPVDVPDLRQAVRDWQSPPVNPATWHWAIGQQESGGNHMLVSPKGAKGAMQVMDATARDPGYGVEPARNDSWQERDRVGNDLLDAYGRHYGDELLATAAYNAGPARVDKWLRTIGDPRTGEISPAQWAERIPFKETRDYVRNVYQRMNMPLPTTPMLRPDLVAEGGPPSIPEMDAIDPIEGESWPDAVTRMRVTESGGAAEALWHPEIGPIDVPWGNAGTGAGDGYGLAKLDAYHPDVVDDLPDIVAGMDVVSQTPNRIQMATPDHKAAVSLNWQGDPARPWLLTAFRRDEDAPAPADDSRVDADGRASPDLGAAPDISATPRKVQSRATRPRAAAQPQETAPVDALTFLADHGGLRDDEGHDLQGRGRLVSGAITGQRRRGGTAGIGLPTFAPGGGFLFRKGGMSIDQAGELLHEAGYFTGDRPTTADVIDMLADSDRRPVYRPEDVAAAHQAEMEARYGSPALEHFSEPDGDGAQMQADGIEHDLHGAIAADPTLTVRLDESGDVVNVADLLAGFDEEAHGVDDLRACSTPGGNEE